LLSGAVCLRGHGQAVLTLHAPDYGLDAVERVMQASLKARRQVMFKEAISGICALRKL
jgi:hypothetical protein